MYLRLQLPLCFLELVLPASGIYFGDANLKFSNLFNISFFCLGDGFKVGDMLEPTYLQRLARHLS